MFETPVVAVSGVLIARVRQMHQQVVLVGAVEGRPRVRREARDAVGREVGAQRRRAREDHVEPQVELEAVEEHRPLEILLDHRARRRVVGGEERRELSVAPHQADARALTARVGLDDEGGRRAVLQERVAVRAVGGGALRPAGADAPRARRGAAEGGRVEAAARVEQPREAHLAADAHHPVEAVDPRAARQREQVLQPERLVVPHDRAARRREARRLAPAELRQRPRQRVAVVLRRRLRRVHLRHVVLGRRRRGRRRSVLDAEADDRHGQRRRFVGGGRLAGGLQFAPRPRRRR